MVGRTIALPSLFDQLSFENGLIDDIVLNHEHADRRGQSNTVRIDR